MAVVHVEDKASDDLELEFQAVVSRRGPSPRAVCDLNF